MIEHKTAFIKKGVVLCIIVVSILLILNQLYLSKLPEINIENGFYRKDADWQNHKKLLANSSNNTLEYAFFGDSHALYAVRPEYLDNSYNLALAAEGYVETYYGVKRVVETEGIKIKTIVLEVDPHTFSDKARTPQTFFRNLRYYRMFVPLDEMAALKKMNPLLLYIKIHLPVIGKGQDLLRLVVTKPDLTKLPEIKQGWVSKEGDFSTVNRTKAAIGGFDGIFREDNGLFDETSFNYFLKVIRLAKEKNMSIIIINYPLSYELQNELEVHDFNRETYYKTIFEEIETVLGNSSSYTVLDYHDLFFEQPEYLADVDHVNTQGAEIFSKKLKEELN